MTEPLPGRPARSIRAEIDAALAALDAAQPGADGQAARLARSARSEAVAAGLATVVDLFGRAPRPEEAVAPPALRTATRPARIDRARPEPDAADVLLDPLPAGESWRSGRRSGRRATDPDDDAVAPVGRVEREALGRLGVELGPDGGAIRVFSGAAERVMLCIYDVEDPTWLVRRVPLRRDEHGVWSGQTRGLAPGTPYTLRADGPQTSLHRRFDPARDLLDPYARSVLRLPDGSWRSLAVSAPDEDAAARPAKPGTALEDSVLYEVHVKGFSRLNTSMPEALRGTYAGLAHWSSIEYLAELGVTAVELLPVQSHVSEHRLSELGQTNYWGYNTVGYFAPHAGYATAAAREAGPDAVVAEFRAMVDALHAAGIEVVLDVVYNHTAEEGPMGPVSSLRGLDDAAYYRQTDKGHYIDVTGCGNTLNAASPAVQHLVLESLAYWAGEMGVDGFRFDLAAALGRDERAHFDPAHPLLADILADPRLAGVKMIAEPWDVGLGGWQVGAFPTGFAEWNDGYRDQIREFWLTDRAAARTSGTAPTGIGSFAGRLTGSAAVYSEERGPIASVNFVTAHDGFTLHDLTAYDVKHNLANGEGNRDGTNDNRSYNHGVEGVTSDAQVLARRRATMRNLLGTLLLSAGVPMLTAGDEFGRSQAGNNNAYCHDDGLSWLPWEWGDEQRDLWTVTQHLIRLRRENAALRPARFGRWGETVPDAVQMDWYNKQGVSMRIEDWDSPDERTLQYLAASSPTDGVVNRILLVVHGLGTDVAVTLPEHDGVAGYELLWNSADDLLRGPRRVHAPGDRVEIPGYSMRLFRAR
jgi:glycogen debranching enzyme